MAVAGLGSSTIDIRARFRDEQNGIETARLLLAAGANLNAADNLGYTALDTAMGRAGGIGRGGNGPVNEVTAGVLLELGATPGTPVPPPAAPQE